jgi:hypothetical protein
VTCGVRWLVCLWVKLFILCDSWPAEGFLTNSPGMFWLEPLKFDGRFRAIIVCCDLEGLVSVTGLFMPDWCRLLST